MNKRQLKKRVSYVCGDLAADIILASYACDSIKRETVNEILNKIATLQEETRAKVSFSFDKTEKDFETPAEYHKARTAYNKKAFEKLRKEFGEKAMAIVKEMNAAVPADVRKCMSPKA